MSPRATPTVVSETRVSDFMSSYLLPAPFAGSRPTGATEEADPFGPVLVNEHDIRGEIDLTHAFWPTSPSFASPPIVPPSHWRAHPRWTRPSIDRSPFFGRAAIRVRCNSLRSRQFAARTTEEAIHGTTVCRGPRAPLAERNLRLRTGVTGSTRRALRRRVVGRTRCRLRRPWRIFLRATEPVAAESHELLVGEIEQPNGCISVDRSSTCNL